MDNIKIRFLDKIQQLDWNQDDYCLVNSAWLPIMGIRENGDLDLIISKQLRKTLLNGADGQVLGLPGLYEKRIRIQPTYSVYSEISGGLSSDELISKFSVTLGNCKLILPRLYIAYKLNRTNLISKEIAQLSKIKQIFKGRFFTTPNEQKLFQKLNKDIVDFKALNTFFKNGKHLEYKWHISPEDWGINEVISYVEKLKIN